MVLTKREKYIAIGSAAAAVLFLLDYVVLTPYFDARSRVADSLITANTEKTTMDQLFTRQKYLQPVWVEMQKGGLKVDPSQAESQTLHSILDWAGMAEFNLSSLKPERTTQEGKFQVISFSITGTGSTPALSRLMWAIETAKIPVRVNDVDVRPLKEGTDSLQARISVSALCLPPDSGKTNKTTGGVQ